MRRAAALGLLLAGCTKAPSVPLCGLHSAAAPLLMRSEGDRMIAIGSKLSTHDRVKAQGPTLLECFGGAVKVLEKGDAVVVGELLEAKIEATPLPRFEVANGRLVELEGAPPHAVEARYSGVRFTPASARPEADPTTGEYLRAFFTPDGLSKLGGPKGEGPSSLPPPHLRVAVPRVHAGPLGSSRRRLEVEDDFVFAETPGLATAVLLEDEVYDLGEAARLVLPKGAEATLVEDGRRLELEGPMDVRLR